MVCWSAGPSAPPTDVWKLPLKEGAPPPKNRLKMMHSYSKKGQQSPTHLTTFTKIGKHNNHFVNFEQWFSPKVICDWDAF